MRLLARLAIGLLFAIPAFAQSGVRVGDGHIVMTTKKVGALNVLVTVPNAAIQFCAYPNIGVPCVNLVTTYTDDTLGTTCPTTAQVTISGSNVCQATADAQGNWGVWLPSGNYSFTVTSSAGVFGPYYITAGGTGGGGGGSGTVTIVSVNDLTPLFTSSVATAGTTPVVSFTLSNAAAHTFFGNNTASSAAPDFQAIGTGDLPLIPAATGLTGLVPIVNGGTGTATPGPIAGTNMTITGTWPNQTFSSTNTAATAFSAITAATNSSAGNFIWSGNTVNASGAAHTLPAVTGTIAGIPATCAVGEFYYATDATVGRTDYRCTATNTWTQVGWSNVLTTLGDITYGGASGVPTRLAGVANATINGLPLALTTKSTAGATTAPLWTLPIYPVRQVTGTTATDTILSLDCYPYRVSYYTSVDVTITLPTATTLGVANCHFRLTNNTSPAKTLTVTPTTWTIVPNTAGSLLIPAGQVCEIFQSASASRWDADCFNLPAIAGTNITITPGTNGPTFAATSTAATAFSALTGSINTTAAMQVGTGASLNVTGTGTINATKIGGITVTGTPSVGFVPTATSSSAATWQAGGGGSGTWAGLTLAGTNTGTSMVLAPTSTTTIPFTINAATGQTSDIFDVNLNSVRKFWIDSTGSMNFAGTNLNVGSSTSTTAAIVAAHGGNTPSLPGCLQVYNNADTLNANLCASGTAGRAAMQSGIATADTVQNYVLKAPAVNPQSAASYAILSSDFGNLVTRTNATAMTDTIARAGAGTTSPTLASFGAGWFVDYCVLQTSPGSSTIQATTSTFSSNGLTLLTVAPGTCTRITSDGTNYKNSMSTAISLSRATIGVGNCASGVSSTWWNTALVAVCRTGSNIIESILPFADADTAQIPQAIDLPADWIGLVDVKAIFSSPSTTGTVIFNVATSCAAVNGTVTDDVAFNAADALSTVTLGGTANAQWASTKSGITTTGCAAGSTMQLKITRATDTASGVANLKNIEVTLRRTNLL